MVGSKGERGRKEDIKEKRKGKNHLRNEEYIIKSLIRDTEKKNEKS